MRAMVSLLGFVAIVAAVAFTAAQFMPGPWYAQLSKPAWNPPNAVFGPVWSLLYLLIAIAGWRVWRDARGASPLLALWAVQLLANGLWSWLFFGLHRPVWALLDIAVLDLAVLLFIARAWPRVRVAAWCFLPYAAWLLFASALNLAIVQLNP